MFDIEHSFRQAFEDFLHKDVFVLENLKAQASHKNPQVAAAAKKALEGGFEILSDPDRE